MKIMNDPQLALELPITLHPRSQRRLRAQWWFDRMRQIIDLAPDPEQLTEGLESHSVGMRSTASLNLSPKERA